MSDIVRFNNNRRRFYSSPVKDRYTADDHIRFLDTELHAQNAQFLKVISRKASDLLNDGLLIPGKFLKIKNGQLIVKTSKKRAVPRKGEYLTAVLLEGNMPDNRNWDALSWRELRIRHQVALSEAVCIWQRDADDEEFNIIGFRRISLEFTTKLIENCIIMFGPQEPPREYLLNLKQLAESKTEKSTFLDFDYKENNWDPVIFDNSLNFPAFVEKQLYLNPYLIIQGPPGTGKTFRLAEFIAKLINDGKKVLVTALTNRALIELAKKEFLKKALDDGLITKHNLSIDEIEELPGLQNSRKEGVEGELVLSTFYTCSSEAITCLNPYYDYVIMDEASQALLGMFEATIRLGKKVVWIGDQNQLAPIVNAGEKDIKHQKAITAVY